MDFDVQKVTGYMWVVAAATGVGLLALAVYDKVTEVPCPEVAAAVAEPTE